MILEQFKLDGKVAVVTGGGRGIGMNNGAYDRTAGNVGGNALITITGGNIKRDVYGGGLLASVGKREFDLEGNPGNPDPNTGWARVKISGGTIGTTENLDNERGNVFGSSRGRAGAAYRELAFVKNTDVTEVLSYQGLLIPLDQHL